MKAFLNRWIELLGMMEIGTISHLSLKFTIFVDGVATEEFNVVSGTKENMGDNIERCKLDTLEVIKG